MLHVYLETKNTNMCNTDPVADPIFVSFSCLLVTVYCSDIYDPVEFSCLLFNEKKKLYFLLDLFMCITIAIYLFL